jgi:chromosomal replication initiation ATPase DnaA
MNLPSYDHLGDVFAKAFLDTGGSIPDALRLIDEYRAQLVAQGHSGLQPQLVVAAAARFFGIPVHRIYRADKQRTVCDARWVAARVLHTLRWPAVQIGHVLGGRDHSTILHALACVKDRPDLITAAEEVLQKALRAQEESAGEVDVAA